MRFSWIAIVVWALALPCAGSRASEQRPELVIYDVTDLTTEQHDFPYEVVPAPIACFAGGRPQGVPTCGSVAEMIKTRIRPDRWNPALGVSIEERGGMLAIMQTAEIHQQITALFTAFREQAKTQIVVKGLLVPSAAIPRETYFNAGALAKLLGPNGAANAFAMPRVVCCNGQRTHVRGTRTFRLIRDYEISGSMYDPVIRDLEEGCIFDVRPLLSHDRRLVTLDLRCILTSAADAAEKRKLTYAPPIAAPGGAKPPQSALELDTPSMQLGGVRTTVRIPAGNWVLAGTIPNPNAEAKEKILLLLVSAESLNKNIVGKPNKIDDSVGKNEVSAPKAPPKPPKDPGPLELRIFDIRDMTTAITDFPAPRESSLRERSQTVDPFAGTPPLAQLTDTDVAALIKEKVLADYFAEPETTVDVAAGKLVVYQRAAVHEKIAALLDEWRDQLMSQVVVRSHLVAAAEVPDETYFDEDAVNAILAREGNSILADYRCVSFNKQLTYAKNGREFSYIRDYDISGDIYEPVVRNGFDGSIMEVRPTRTSDCAAVQLDVSFSLNSDVTRITRTLGIPSDAGARATATITSSSSDSSVKKYQIPPPAPNAPPKTEKDVAEESSTTTTQTTAGLLDGKFIAGCELDSLAMSTREMATQVVVPKNKWVLAAVASNGNPKGPKHLLLFVTAEVLEPAK